MKKVMLMIALVCVLTLCSVIAYATENDGSYLMFRSEPEAYLEMEGGAYFPPEHTSDMEIIRLPSENMVYHRLDDERGYYEGTYVNPETGELVTYTETEGIWE